MCGFVCNRIETKRENVCITLNIKHRVLNTMTVLFALTLTEVDLPP